MKNNLNKNLIERYSRQIVLKNLGVVGQKNICKSKVLIIGAGGLGCPAADYLSRAGVGTIGIADFDKINLSNIHRQNLYNSKDTGEVTVAAPDEESRLKAMKMIKDIIAKPEMNKIYKGKVIKIMEFGAFVNFLGKQDGLVHISELAPKRVAKVTDVVKEGDEVTVKVIGFDRGKVKLSIKQAVA